MSVRESALSILGFVERPLPDGNRADFQVVEDNFEEKWSIKTRIVLLVIGAAVLLFGLVAFNVVLSQGQFELKRLQSAAEEQQRVHDRLRLQVADLESPEVITQVATNRLGMVVPERVEPFTPTKNDIPNGLEVRDSSSNLHTPPTDEALRSWSEMKPDLTRVAP